MLRKVNQIRTITGTLQVEGSTLDEERITALDIRIGGAF